MKCYVIKGFGVKKLQCDNKICPVKNDLNYDKEFAL